MRTRGTLAPVIYFVNEGRISGSNSDEEIGWITLAPYSEARTPEGHSRHEAGTLSEVDTLQKRMQEQEHRKLEKELQLDENHMREARAKVRDSLYSRMVSSSTSEYERDFIKAWMELRDQKRRDYFRQRLEEHQCFITAREMDLHGRSGNEERYKGTLNEHGK